VVLNSRTPGAAASGTPTIATGTVLTNTTLGGFTQIDQVDMLSPQLGYALATHYVGKDNYRYYLIRTTNLARTWTVRSQIPGLDARFPIFTDFDTFDSDQFIEFVNRNVGYVDGAGGIIYVTDDAGLRWQKISTYRSTTSYAVNGATTSVVSTNCVPTAHANVQKCTSAFTQYALGSATPLRTSSIPGATHEPLTALIAVAPPATEIIDEDNDSESSATSLLQSDDGGRVWSRLSNPCHGLLIEQLVVSKAGPWLLSCFLDGGSYHGTAKIFRSDNDGVTWTTVQDLDHDGDGGPVYLFYNGDDQVLYSVSLGPAGGIASSTDGGSHWSPERVLGYSGGSPGSLTNFGPTSSLYQVFQGPMYVTSNGRTWRILRPLRAGTYEGLSICTSRHMTVRLRHVRSGRLDYTFVDFTNHAATSCYLDGAPNEQPLAPSGASVGPPNASDSYDSNGQFVVVKGGGGVAHVSLFVNSTAGYKPASSCRPEDATSIRLTFGFPSEFVLRTHSRPWSVCTVFPSVDVDAVGAGPGKP